MTTATWTTIADVPPGNWAATVTDLRGLLDTWHAAGHAAVTGPDGTGAPVYGADTLAFSVALPNTPPLSVTFTRAAGAGTVTTGSPVTDALVLIALRRAARHWGRLLTWTSDAGTEAQAIAGRLGDRMYGDGDRAVGASAVPLNVETVIATARIAVDNGVALTHQLGLGDYLSALISELANQLTGIATADQLTTVTALR